MSAIALFDQPSNQPVSVHALIKRYLTYLNRRAKSGEVSEDHVLNVQGDLRNYEAFVGARLVCECRQFDLTEWLRSNPAWKSVHTQKRAISSVLGCFSWGADDEEGSLIERNPYRFPKILKGKAAPSRRPALPDEYRALMLAGSVALRKALLFMWRTGARTCEMREMTFDDVIFGDHPHVRLEHHKTVRKTGQPRIIPLSPAMARYLTWLKKSATSNFVFTNTDGRPWDRNTFARHLRRTAQRIGLDNDLVSNVTGYCLRHSYACAAVEGGSTFEQTADQLGNSAEIVRKVYASHTRRHLGYMVEVAAQIARRRRGK